MVLFQFGWPFIRRTLGMNPGTLTADPHTSQVDAIEEMRLRTWARRNYAPAAERSNEWHPVVLEEMALRDREASR